MNTLDDEFDIAPWAAPEVIDGRYRVIRKVGRGGFADVYLAEHVNVPGLLVAIKVLLSHRSDDPGLVSRFKREAVALASLRSRHTVRIHDLGVVDNLPYLVMEFLENVPLSSVLDMQGRISRGQAAIVAIGVLKALLEAHAAGIVHRDLKPDNILLTLEPGERHPVPRVIDFGIAKLLATPTRASSGTTTGGNVRFCTPEYAAPEVLEGQPGYQSDLYSLGHTLAELVDGKPPYAARTVIAAAAMHLDPHPVPLGERAAHGPLGRVIRRACAKQLGKRYPDAASMLADLKKAVAELEKEEGRTEPLQIGSWVTVRADELRFAAALGNRQATQSGNVEAVTIGEGATLGLDDPLVTGDRDAVGDTDTSARVRDTGAEALDDPRTTIVPVPRIGRRRHGDS